MPTIEKLIKYFRANPDSGNHRLLIPPSTNAQIAAQEVALTAVIRRALGTSDKDWHRQQLSHRLQLLYTGPVAQPQDGYDPETGLPGHGIKLKARNIREAMLVVPGHNPNDENAITLLERAWGELARLRFEVFDENNYQYAYIWVEWAYVQWLLQKEYISSRAVDQIDTFIARWAASVDADGLLPNVFQAWISFTKTTTPIWIEKLSLPKTTSIFALVSQANATSTPGIVSKMTKPPPHVQGQAYRGRALALSSRNINSETTTQTSLAQSIPAQGKGTCTNSLREEKVQPSMAPESASAPTTTTARASTKPSSSQPTTSPVVVNPDEHGFKVESFFINASKKYKCPVDFCGSSYANTRLFVEHLRTGHIKNWQCTQCKSLFTRLENGESHLQAKAGCHWAQIINLDKIGWPSGKVSYPVIQDTTPPNSIIRNEQQRPSSNGSQDGRQTQQLIPSQYDIDAEKQLPTYAQKDGPSQESTLQIDQAVARIVNNGENDTTSVDYHLPEIYEDQEVQAKGQLLIQEYGAADLRELVIRESQLQAENDRLQAYEASLRLRNRELTQKEIDHMLKSRKSQADVDVYIKEKEAELQRAFDENVEHKKKELEALFEEAVNERVVEATKQLKEELATIQKELEEQYDTKGSVAASEENGTEVDLDTIEKQQLMDELDTLRKQLQERQDVKVDTETIFQQEWCQMFPNTTYEKAVVLIHRHEVQKRKALLN